MKSYKEMAEDVFRRIEEYNEKKRRRERVLARSAASIGAAALAFLLGFGIWKGADARKMEREPLQGSGAIEQQGGVSADASRPSGSEDDSREKSPSSPESSEPVGDGNAEASKDNSGQTDESNVEISKQLGENSTDASGESGDVTDRSNAETSGESGESGNDEPWQGGYHGNVADIMMQLSINGVEYLEARLLDPADFTAEECLGTAGDFWIVPYPEAEYSFNPYLNRRVYSTDEVFSVKDDPDAVLLVLSDGNIMVLIRIGEITVNGRSYFLTGWDPDDYTKAEYLGRASELGLTDFPRHWDPGISAADKIFSVHEDERVLLLEKPGGGLTVMLEEE